MKAKRISLVLAFMCAVCLVFSSCGSESKSYDVSFNDNSMSDSAGQTSPEYYPEEPVEEEIAVESPSIGTATDSDLDESITESQTNDVASRKLIKNVHIDLETKNFDEFISSLEAAVNEYGGFVQSSSINGNSYYYTNSRSADYTVRIPCERLDDFRKNVGSLGNVTSSSESLEDVTMTYVDIESRIKALETERDVLLELLAKSENVESIIAVQSRISEVNYQLESYESRKRTYDDLISYSTVYIKIHEVERETIVEKQSMGDEISENLQRNLEDIGNGFKRFAINFVSNLPYIGLYVVFGAIGVIIIVAVVKAISKHEKKAQAKMYQQAQTNTNSAASQNNTENKNQ